MAKLGNLKIKNKFVLAPMASYSDISLRTICYEYGCGYAFSELIHAPAFIRKLDALKQKLDFYDKEGIGIQFVANNPDELKEAIRMVNGQEFYPLLENIRSIDLNLGCPTPDLMDNNLGASLLNQPSKIRELFSVMRRHSALPVSAKIRLAINSKHKNTKPYLRIAKIAKEEELDFITVHARTAGQQYAGEIDLAAIKEIRENVDIPLVGNGNVVDEETASEMLSHCDAVMIGRKAVKEPFIFSQLNYFMEHGKKLKIDENKEKRNCIKEYLSLAEKYGVGFQHIKIHMQSLLKGTGNKKIIMRLTHTNSTAEIRALIMQAKM